LDAKTYCKIILKQNEKKKKLKFFWILYFFSDLLQKNKIFENLKEIQGKS